jgi:hypothetical protein
MLGASWEEGRIPSHRVQRRRVRRGAISYQHADAAAERVRGGWVCPFVCRLRQFVNNDQGIAILKPTTSSKTRRQAVNAGTFLYLFGDHGTAFDYAFLRQRINTRGGKVRELGTFTALSLESCTLTRTCRAAAVTAATDKVLPSISTARVPFLLQHERVNDSN